MPSMRRTTGSFTMAAAKVNMARRARSHDPARHLRVEEDDIDEENRFEDDEEIPIAAESLDENEICCDRSAPPREGSGLRSVKSLEVGMPDQEEGMVTARVPASMNRHWRGKTDWNQQRNEKRTRRRV